MRGWNVICRLCSPSSGDEHPQVSPCEPAHRACREKAPSRLECGRHRRANQGHRSRGSLTHVIKTFAPKLQRQTEMIQGDARTAVSALVESSRKRN